MQNKLVIKGAREHNLKNIDLTLTKNQLIIISGISGSRKSSRRSTRSLPKAEAYVESLSSCRMFLDKLDKPDVDYMEGLSPAIAIEQRSTQRNVRPSARRRRSYFRLLWARVWARTAMCRRKDQRDERRPDHRFNLQGERSKPDHRQQPRGDREEGEFRKVFEDAKAQGYHRLVVDGQQIDLEDGIPALDKQIKHSIDIIVDRLILSADIRTRLASSIETAIEMTQGLVKITFLEVKQVPPRGDLQRTEQLPHCGITLPELEPRLFSFNNPFGACPSATAWGSKRSSDPDLIIPDYSKSFNEGAIATMNPDAQWSRGQFSALAKHIGITLDTPFSELNEEQLRRSSGERRAGDGRICAG